ncbi:MAG: hypothetical protein GWO20_11310, partial [Candidatus Korarchaeota archaeon]|nr:hypothetical protein [Candidatus Korarchaeota archaeon]
NGVRIHGTEGSLVATGKKRQITIYSDDNEGSETLSVDSKKSSHERQLDVFLNAIERQKTPITSGFNERNTLAVIEAGYQSMRRGNAIPVDLRS